MSVVGGHGPIRVIAIDGPAGAGKSTVAKALATRLGLDYLDTGAMYRAVTFAVLRRRIDPDDEGEVAAVAVDVDLDVHDGEVVVDGVDATLEIRGPEVTSAVSVVAANPGVRAELRDRQREWARKHGGGVIEGRDIGSVVFPDAELKLYLTASPEVRAQRRHQEARELDYESVRASIDDRDRIDSSRTDSPLTEAHGPLVIDTTGRPVAEIVDEILGRLELP
jgi:CMP/dCMP kinase